jgi:hypothetical protein
VAERRITHAMKFRDAVWDAPCTTLSTVERLVLLCYADHAYNGSDSAWVIYRRLMDRCGIRSMSTVTRVLASLRAKGWLKMVNPSRCKTSSAHYQLGIPEVAAPMSGASSATGVAPMSEGVAPIIDGSAPMSGAICTDGGHLPSGEESLKTLPADATPPDSVPASRSETETPASVTAIEAKAQLAALLAKTRPAKVSRWNTPRVETPNPMYDPQRALRLVTDAEEGVA